MTTAGYEDPTPDGHDDQGAPPPISAALGPLLAPGWPVSMLDGDEE